MLQSLDRSILAALTIVALATACTPLRAANEPAAETTSASDDAAPAASSGGEAAPKTPSEPAAAKPALSDGPLHKPASKLTFGGVSLSTIDAKQAVAAFKKAGYRAVPTPATADPTTLAPSAFGNVTGHWEALEFELTPLGSSSVAGNAEIVRPAKKTRSAPASAEADRSAAGTVTRYEQMTQGLLTGGGMYDSESETSFSVMLTSGAKDKSASALVRRLVTKAP